jgi:hypothetical protein
MWKLIPIVLASSLATMAQAQTITDPDQIASRLKFWSQESNDPVYYGEVRNVNRRTMTGTSHYQCLALAFIKYEAGVFHYAHKMWAKSRDGSCHYEDVISRKVGNHGACVRDTNAGFGAAIGTARMTKDNIDWANSRFRTVNTRTRRVGEYCIPRATAGLYSVRIENGRFKVITTRPLDYEVSIEPQDPHNPPTKPVF